VVVGGYVNVGDTIFALMTMMMIVVSAQADVAVMIVVPVQTDVVIIKV
jgi:hypothetical protein